MSKYYVIGSDVELNTINEDFNLKKIDIEFLKNNNQEYFTDKYHYLINFKNLDIGYDIRNINDFYTDTNKIFFDKFLTIIDNYLIKTDKISFYQLWETNQIDSEENKILENKELSTDSYDYPEDYFQFELNTKYSFVKKKENNLEL